MLMCFFDLCVLLFWFDMLFVVYCVYLVQGVWYWIYCDIVLQFCMVDIVVFVDVRQVVEFLLQLIQVEEDELFVVCYLYMMFEWLCVEKFGLLVLLLVVWYYDFVCD